MGYKGRGNVPTHGTITLTGLGRPLPWPPIPLTEIERITGKLHLSTYCRQEAVREYEAFLRGQDHHFQTPETDCDGYVVVKPFPPMTGSGKTSSRPAAPVPKEPPPIKS